MKARLQRLATLNIFLKALTCNCSTLVFWAFSAEILEPKDHKFSTVMTFVVRVPVLSEAITVALPSVSKHSNCLMYTFLSPSLLAMIVRQEVTVAGRPCGTLATITMMNPLMNIARTFSWVKFARIRMIPITKKAMAMINANIAMNVTKALTSFLKDELSEDVPVTFVAILPMKVLFPVLITIPMAPPS